MTAQAMQILINNFTLWIYARTLSREWGYNCRLHCSGQCFNASLEEHSWRLHYFVRYLE